MSARATTWKMAIGVGVALACAAAVAACGSDSNTVRPGIGTDAAAGDAAIDAPDLTPEEQFRALQDELVGTCGGTNGACHVLGSFESAPKWLANPDPYVSAKNYPGILPASGDANDSILLTQIEHEGPSLQSHPDLFGKVRAWIAAELAGKQLPETDPFPVTDGFNSVDLSKLGAGLMGAKLTFLAMTNQNGDILTLTSMKLYSPTMAGLHADSPFFIIVPSMGKVNADPVVNGFTGPLDVPTSSSVDFYSGQIILLKWDPNGQLRVAFKALDAVAGTTDAGPTGDCTALPSFIANAVPAFKMPVTIPDGGGMGSCFGCHGGSDQVATNALDLSALDTDNAHACAQARNWINFANKSMSTIVLNPQGLSNPMHPINSLMANDPIVTGIDTWVQAEQP